VRHPSLKGGTMISFPVHVHVQNKEGIHRKTIFRGIPGPGAALVEFLMDCWLELCQGNAGNCSTSKLKINKISFQYSSTLIFE
jgi:hypothetical protein